MKYEKAELAYAGLPVSFSKAKRLLSNLLICVIRKDEVETKCQHLGIRQ